MKISFEKKTCGRCSGAGYFSHYAHVYNGACFGCNGVGTKLTRNGSNARKAYDEAMSVEASELKVGMVIWDIGIDGKDRRRMIESINPSTGSHTSNGVEIPMLTFTYKNINMSHSMAETHTVRMALSPENRHLAIEALAKLKGATITETEEVTA